jgi:hypothetical protein
MWYNFSYKLWLFGQDTIINKFEFRNISVKTSKRILKYIFIDRYTNRKYISENFKNRGNIKISYSEENQLTISFRSLDSFTEDIDKNYSASNSEDKIWEKLDYGLYNRIIKSIDLYSKSPRFTGVYLKIHRENNPTILTTDFILCNWNLVCVIVIFILTLIEYLKNKKKKKEEKVTSF